MSDGPFKATVQSTALVTLHTVEHASGRALVLWFTPNIWAACIGTPKDLFDIMDEGTRIQLRGAFCRDDRATKREKTKK